MPSSSRSEPVPAFFSPRRLRTERGLLHLLRRAQLAVAQLVNEETDSTGSTFPQWLPLHKIHQGAASTVAELARVCTVDTGAMTRMLDRLEAKGLCRRVRSQSDRRVVHIELTPAGVVAAEHLPEVVSRVYNRVLAGFSAEEWARLQELLVRLADRAERLSVRKAGNVNEAIDDEEKHGR